MILDEAQVGIMKRARAKVDAYREAKRDAEARVRERVAEEISGYQLSMDLELRHAVDAGIPKMRIYNDVLGTKDSRTLEKSLARTVVVATAIRESAETPASERFALDGESLTITLTGKTLTDALVIQDWERDEQAAVRLGVHRAEFKVVERADGSRFLQPETPLIVTGHGRAHPVVTWANLPVNEAEALRWWEEAGLR